MIRSVCCAYLCLTIYHHPPPSPLCCSSGKGDTGLKLASRFDQRFLGQGNRIWYRVGPHLETMEGGGGGGGGFRPLIYLITFAGSQFTESQAI